MRKGTICYFDDYGKANTPAGVQIVIERLGEGDIGTVVVASSSGETAVKLAEGMSSAGRGERIICVSDPPYAVGRPTSWPRLSPDKRDKLASLGVEIVDWAPYASMAYSWKAAENVYGALDLLVVVFDAFRMVGGNGLKVAIEVALMATNVGKVKPGDEVISIGGTARGADMAIVMKAAYSCDIFAKDLAKRPEVREILAMPRTRKWWW